jgi:ketosteroid isomerase-like protein
MRERGRIVNQIEELNRLVDNWANAELAGDTDSLRATLADDFVGVGPRGFTLTKEQWLARHEAGNLMYESFGLDEAEVRPYGDAAVAVCRQTAEGVYEDENGRYDIHEQFRATLVFVRQRGRWLLAGLQLSPILDRP